MALENEKGQTVDQRGEELLGQGVEYNAVLRMLEAEFRLLVELENEDPMERWNRIMAIPSFISAHAKPLTIQEQFAQKRMQMLNVEDWTRVIEASA